jgi:hypothetical protein
MSSKASKDVPAKPDPERDDAADDDDDEDDEDGAAV